MRELLIDQPIFIGFKVVPDVAYEMAIASGNPPSADAYHLVCPPDRGIMAILCLRSHDAASAGPEGRSWAGVI